MAGLVRPSTTYWRTKKDVDARHRRQVYAVCAKQTAMPGHDDIEEFGFVTDYGFRIDAPVVALLSRSVWALAASFSA